MGQRLYASNGRFRACFDALATLVKEEAGFSLTEMIFDGDEGRLDQTEVAQIALLTLELALAQWWAQGKVEPRFLLGHSIGEFAAMCFAGALDERSAIRLVNARGRMMQSLPTGGGMTAISTDANTVRSWLRELGAPVQIAAMNSPVDTVVSGPLQDVDRVAERATREGVPVKRLRVSHAFHSELMRGVADAFGEVASSVSYAKPRIPVISNVTGKAHQAAPSAAYWVEHLLSPVHFLDGLKELCASDVRVFLEVGPGSGLSHYGAQTESARTFVASLSRRRDDLEQVASTAARLYSTGIDVDLAKTTAPDDAEKVDVPLTPFLRKRHWIEPDTRVTSREARHPFLARQLSSPAIGGKLVFESEVRSSDYVEHLISGQVLLPAAAMIEAFSTVSGRIDEHQEFELKELGLLQPCRLEATQRRTLQIVVESGTRSRRVSLFSRSGGLDEDGGEGWVEHCNGTLSPSGPSAPADDVANARARCTTDASPDAFYEKARATGLGWGPSYRGIRKIQVGPTAATVEVSSDERSTSHEFAPWLLDACLQSLHVALGQGGAPPNLWLPISLELARLRAPAPGPLNATAVLRDGGTSAATVGDVVVFDSSGALVAEVRGYCLRQVQEGGLSTSTRVLRDAPHELAWVPQPSTVRVAFPTLSPALLLGSEAPAFAKRLEEAGVEIERRTAASAADMASLAPRTIVVVDRSWSGTTEPPADRHQDLIAQATALRDALLAASELPTPPRFVLLTRGARGASAIASSTALTSLLRVAAQEFPSMTISAIDFQRGERDDDLDNLLAEFVTLDREGNISYQGGERSVARLARVVQTDRRLTTPPTAYRLTANTPGDIESLAFVAEGEHALGDEDVEVKVVAAGVNFRDVLGTLGMYPGSAGALGRECVGVVGRVGAAVTDLAVGTRVVAMAEGTFASTVVVPRTHVLALPDGISDDAAATLPVSFLTAVHGLKGLADAKPGQTILIHAAAGALGMAATQLARAGGLKVIATASKLKWGMLRRMGVDAVGDSRSLQFVDVVREFTNGEGPDIVLNSLSGELLRASFDLTKRGGCFLEVGKRDILTQEEARELRPDIRYHAYDLHEIGVRDPKTIRGLFDELGAALATSRVVPLPYRTFDVSQAGSAFRLMSSGKHTGKLVLRVTHDEKSFGTSLRPAALSLDSRGSYIVSGGAGGLGLRVAELLGSRGAGEVILLGRRAPEDEAPLDRLRSLGCRVQFAKCDVQVEADVRAALAKASFPVRGIVHAAGILQDRALANMSQDDFAAVIGPKVKGAVHFGSFAREHELEFLVFFSSATALLGTPGQANYAAANAYLDGYASELREDGIAAISIAWGPWQRVGMAATEGGPANWARGACGAFTPEDALVLLERTLIEKPTYAALLPYRWDAVGTQAPELRALPLLRQLLEQRLHPRRRTTDRSDLLDKLKATPATEQWLVMSRHIEATLLRTLGMSPSQRLNWTQGFTELGLDSLMAVQIRNALQLSIRKPLPHTVTFSYPNIRALADFIVGEVLKEPSIKPPPPPPPRAPSVRPAAESAGNEDDDLAAELSLTERLLHRRS